MNGISDHRTSDLSMKMKSLHTCHLRANRLTFKGQARWSIFLASLNQIPSRRIALLFTSTVHDYAYEAHKLWRNIQNTLLYFYHLLKHKTKCVWWRCANLPSSTSPALVSPSKKLLVFTWSVPGLTHRLSFPIPSAHRLTSIAHLFW